MMYEDLAWPDEYSGWYKIRATSISLPEPFKFGLTKVNEAPFVFDEYTLPFSVKTKSLVC